jgi:transcriptional regulator with XRE-family HTH domain
MPYPAADRVITQCLLRRREAAMAERGGPSVRHRRLAAELRRLREDAGLSGDEVAASLGWSGSKVSRIETCRTEVKSADLGKLLEFYQVPAGHRDELIALVTERRRRGWWESYTDVLPQWYAAYIVLESEAESIYAWNCELINGLLQTEGYARAVNDETGNQADPPGEISRRVEARLRRQSILTGENPTDVTFVLDESVLLRRFGGAEIMRGQLAHLIETSRLPNVSLRVLPLGGAHPVSGGGAFTLTRFTPVPEIGPVSDVVHVEQLGKSAVYIEGESETYPYWLAFGKLMTEALGEDQSRKLIAKTMQTAWS